jgi:hypothetical protein
MWATALIRNFLADSIVLPFDADHNVVNVENISVKLVSRIIMLVVEPDSCMSRNDIFTAPDKDTQRAQVDDKSLSFDKKWNLLANDYFNATYFDPENSWKDKDSQVAEFDPQMPPAVAWTGEQLCKHFYSLKTKFALVEDMFCHSGNL